MSDVKEIIEETEIELEEFLSYDFKRHGKFCEFCQILREIDEKLIKISNSYEGHEKEKWSKNAVSFLRCSLRKEFDTLFMAHH